MREIKFRGKRIDNQEWVYGYLVIEPHGDARIYYQPFDGCSTNTYHFVDQEKICQYTGLKDKNGTGIYEGDIVQDTTGYHGIKEVFYKNGSWKIIGKLGQPIGIGSWSKKLILIGNIHE